MPTILLKGVTMTTTSTNKVLRIRKLMVQYAKTNSKVTKDTIAILISLEGGLR